ncbi:hypothetical protein [Streptomyces sp. WG-D5]
MGEVQGRQLADQVAVLGTHRLGAAFADPSQRHGRGQADAATAARVVSAVMFLAMAAGMNVAASVDEIVRDIREQIASC